MGMVPHTCDKSFCPKLEPMVKRAFTSIITLAVLMGVLVACSGSDSEVAELRAELE